MGPEIPDLGKKAGKTLARWKEAQVALIVLYDYPRELTYNKSVEELERLLEEFSLKGKQ